MIEVDIRPESLAKMKDRGIGLPMVGRTLLHPETALEPPTYVQRIAPRSPVRIGAFCSIATSLNAVNVGRYSAIGADCVFGANEHPTDRLTTSRMTYVSNLNGWADFLRPDDPSSLNANLEPFTKACPQTHIGNDVWIGQGAFVKAGVTIGDGAIVAARSTVTKDIAPYTIVGGSPAKVIRKRFPDEVIDRLLEIRWWRYNLYDFRDLTYSDVPGALDKIAAQIQAGDVDEFKPSIVKAEDIRDIVNA